MFVAAPNLWCPFDDGTALAQWNDDARTAREMLAAGFSQADVDGMFAYEELFDRLRASCGSRPATPGSARRPTGPSSRSWSGTTPS